MALGGAFAALADDATAAFANPAGLVQLIEPELSAEGRSSSRRTELVEGGRVSGEPSGLGVDTAAGLRRGASESDQIDVPFAAFVYPAGRWSFALYLHTWADFDFSSRLNGLFGVEEGKESRAGDLHRYDVLHRDLKPSNVLIDKAGEPRIADFGLARLQGSPGITGSGTFLGTPAYASPEQAMGEGLDPRSDLYALGVVMFEMVTRYLHVLGASAGTLLNIPGCDGLPLDLDAIWAAIDNLE